MEKTLTSSLLIITIILFSIFGCDKQITDVNQIQIEIEKLAIVPTIYSPSFEIALWAGNKTAAYSITFDDVRESHYTTTAPELEKRNIRGTFFLNTKVITNWSPWLKLFLDGHEIGSHTWSHPKCTEISTAELTNEISKAIHDIKTHIFFCRDVFSFAYPYGLSDKSVQKVVSKYHLVARGAWGINPYNPTSDDFYCLKNIGVGWPAFIDEKNQLLHKAIKEKGWIVYSFHSVNDINFNDAYSLSLELFRNHIDYVSGLSDSLWIAPLGNVTRYIHQRTNTTIISTIDENIITLYLDCNCNFKLVPLTVIFNLPDSWQDKDIYLLNYENTKSKIKRDNDYITINIIPNQKYKLFAYN